MFPLQLKVHCQVLFVHFLCWPKSVPLQLTSRETVVAWESDIIATSGWAGWVSGFIRECFKTEPRSINAFFADKFISTMSSWLPASYHPPSRSVHFWTKITPLSHLSKTTSNPICSGKMCSVIPKSTQEPEVLKTFIWENNIVWHETEIWGGGESALCKMCIQFKLWYKIHIFHRPLAIWHPTELQCRRWNQSWFMERWTRKGLGRSCILVDSSIIGNWIALLIYWGFNAL